MINHAKMKNEAGVLGIRIGRKWSENRVTEN
jgi:hypothetical protein